MLFSDITDCEMLIFRGIQEAKEPVSLLQIMENVEKKYEKDWKRSTVCTFISHLIEKGYVKAERKGRVFYYSSAINNKKFVEEQTRQFMQFWYYDKASELVETILAIKKIPKKDAAELIARLQEKEEA